MDLTFHTSAGSFNVRVGAVIVADDRLLLQGDRRCSFLVPPGGRCSLHESTRQAAARELREELGCDATIGRLLWLIENFFVHEGKAVHEVGFLYEAALPVDSAILAQTGDFPGAEPEPMMFFRWVPLAVLPSLEIYPQLLRGFSSLPSTTAHTVVDERPPLRRPAPLD